MYILLFKLLGSQWHETILFGVKIKWVSWDCCKETDGATWKISLFWIDGYYYHHISFCTLFMFCGNTFSWVHFGKFATKSKITQVYRMFVRIVLMKLPCFCLTTSHERSHDKKLCCEGMNEGRSILYFTFFYCFNFKLNC